MEEPEEVYNEDDFEEYPESAFDESNDKAYLIFKQKNVLLI